MMVKFAVVLLCVDWSDITRQDMKQVTSVASDITWGQPLINWFACWDIMRWGSLQFSYDLH